MTKKRYLKEISSHLSTIDLDEYVIHHIDKKRTNNSFENLVLIHKNTHEMWHNLDRLVNRTTSQQRNFDVLTDIIKTTKEQQNEIRRK